MLLYNFQSGFQNSGSQAKLMNGNNYTNYIDLGQLWYNNAGCHYGGGSYQSYHVVIGAGNTPPTKDDYDLADSSIMASDKMASLSQVATFSKTYGPVVTVQWQNKSDSVITIKEIGLAFKVAQTAYSKGANILVARQVLSTPITIQPNETYAFTYNIKA